jgi:alpha-N-arabinofuranosidase
LSLCGISLAEAAEIGKTADATIRVRAVEKAKEPIPKYITGKFCEHLGTNIYNGMDAQILRNPTFAEFPFSAGHTPDGLVAFQTDREQIARQLRQQARWIGWPDDQIERLVEARDDALACWWIRAGNRQAVQVSPDTGPHGGRAQRVEVAKAGEGIAQWTCLPLHRVRKYEFEILARSPEETGTGSEPRGGRKRETASGSVPVPVSCASLTVSIFGGDSDKPLTTATVKPLTPEWTTLRGTLELDARQPADAVYRFAIAADAPGQFVVRHALLRPADHVHGADPDVVRLLKDSRLPLLRWPGGNFVSAYHWEDGVGPIAARPTRPNYAWGGIETHLFGTAEFIAFCRAVGCEPMICINAGTGTPAEAARWIEYCNGAADTPQGKLRAAHGHPRPFSVRHWEIGNELWGRWQANFTTAAGYVDRYRQFHQAMAAADPTIRLYSCGAPAMWGRDWNRTLIRGVGPSLATITDHPLIGGTVSPATDPLDVFRDFMAVPDVLAGKWAQLQSDMREGGIAEPRLAVTELQLFARIGPGGDEKAKLTRETLVSPPTMAEALYNVLIYHRAIRMAPFVEMVTHSATVNHGGGLRKERERVYANPCHWAQAGFAALGGARPVAVEVSSPKETAPMVLPELKNAAKQAEFDALDALAAVADDGTLLLSIVHRGSGGPLRVNIVIDDFAAGPRAEVHTLSADVPWAVNSLQSPDAIRPKDSTLEIRGGKLTLDVKPYTWVRVRIPRRS